MLKKAKWLVAALMAACLVFVGCNNDDDDDEESSSTTLSGTYKITSAVSSDSTISISGSTITVVADGTTIVITKSDESYTATMNGVDATELLGGADAVKEMYDSCNFDVQIAFSDGKATWTDDEGSMEGTYTVDGNTATITIDGETETVTTSDSWQTFVLIETDEDGTTTITFTKQA